MSYLTFLELYKAEIKAHLCSMDNITNSKATEIWFKATITFSERVYEIMNYILKKYKCSLLINRNPTINYGSMLIMRVNTIKKDKNDYTMSLPIQVLRILNADDA